MHLQVIEISPEQLVALVQQMPIWLLYHRHQRQSNNWMYKSKQINCQLIVKVYTLSIRHLLRENCMYTCICMHVLTCTHAVVCMEMRFHWIIKVTYYSSVPYWSWISPADIATGITGTTARKHITQCTQCYRVTSACTKICMWPCMRPCMHFYFITAHTCMHKWMNPPPYFEGYHAFLIRERLSSLLIVHAQERTIL